MAAERTPHLHTSPGGGGELTFFGVCIHVCRYLGMYACMCVYNSECVWL